MAVKATVTIDDQVMAEARQLVSRRRFKSFNSLVETALRDELARIREEEIRSQIRVAADDPLFLADIADVTYDFSFADNEGEVQ